MPLLALVQHMQYLLLGPTRRERARRRQAVPPALAALAVAAWLGAASVPAQGQIVLSGPAVTADASIYEEKPDDNGGAGSVLVSGRTAGNLNDNGQVALSRRALLRFDLSGIPAGTPIAEAELQLEITMAPGGAPSSIYSLHRLTRAWVEGSQFASGRGGGLEVGAVTWASAEFPGVSWTTPGGDFDPTSSASTDVGISTGVFSWSGAGLVADIEGWIDDPSTNFGWILIGDESTLLTARIFASSDANFGMRPTLRLGLVEAEFFGPSASEDTTLFEDAPDTNGGGAQLIFAGRTDLASPRRALLRFDLAPIPPFATIQAVELDLVVANVPPGGPANTHALHRVTSSWVEGTQGATGSGGSLEVGAASWDSREEPAVAWTTAGGDFEPSPSATVAIGTSPGPVTLSGAGMVADVQAWLDGTAPNNGWILLGDETLNQSVRGYRSSESPMDPPALRVFYNYPGGVGTSILRLR